MTSNNPDCYGCEGDCYDDVSDRYCDKYRGEIEDFSFE